MKANAVPLLGIFEKKMRLEVPLFQRQYVWSKEQQWEPLWEDISRKFTEYLEGRKDAPVHFLGAMVLDQKQTPTMHVERRQVIDGQQRLTTLQIFLAAFRDFCADCNCSDLARECEGFTFNRGMMADPETERFKVWPTQSDREQFADVVGAGSRVELEKRHPVVRRKFVRKPEPRPRMVEAYLFFCDQIQEFFHGTPSDPALAGEVPLAARLEECFQSLKNSLQVVAIDLEQGDDAQVIFETLNARGEPLLPADLLRNYIFLRAARAGEAQEVLYRTHWKPFDEPFWRVPVKQGRLLRPRSDLLMQHFLSSRQCVDIPIKHLFVEYKFWIDRKQPFPSVADELACLARQGAHFRRIIEPERCDVIHPLSTFLDMFDIRTSYPLLLALFDANSTDAQWGIVSKTLESYLVRRAVCGLTTKNYNRIFLTLTRAVRNEGLAAENLGDQLRGQSGSSTEWPADAAFADAWRTRHVYQTLNNPKVVYILRRLNDTFFTSKSERLSIDNPLSVEHILPQQWLANWPLPDGQQGMTATELMSADGDEPRVQATRRRNRLVQTFGNLTIVTQALNSAASNGEWARKKQELLYSLLPINQSLQGCIVWDENTIESRSGELLRRALALWPRE